MIKSEKVNVLFFSFFYSFIVVFLCFCFNRNFFNIDDALNEMLGFYSQYGKIWLSGNIPFIVDSMLAGGNGVIDLGKGLFLPQTILSSLFTREFGIEYTGVFLALINIFIVTISGFYISKRFNIRDVYSYGFAAFLAIQPIFIYQYSAGWWNAANGHAWSVASVASFLVLRNKLSLASIILNFLSVSLLLMAGWPHGVIGYVVFSAFFVVYDIRKNSEWSRVLFIIIPSLLAFLCTLPIYSEYILSKELISRTSGFNNHNNFLVPEWSSIIMGFMPSYYSYISYFGGYKLVAISMAFSTLFFPVIFFYRKISSIVKHDSLIHLIISLIIAYFILTQMPSQFGSLRWPFRFIPFLSMMICLFTFYILDKSETVKYNKAYCVFVLLTFLISIFSSLGFNHEPVRFVLIQFLSFLILLFIPYFLQKSVKAWFLVAMANMALIIMLLGSSTLGGYVPHYKLLDRIEIPKEINLSGYYLSTTGDGLLGGYPDKKTLNDINSSQFGIYDIKTIGGYSPVGHSKLDLLLPHPSSHTRYTKDALINVLKDSELPGYCMSDLMHITTISLSNLDYNDLKNNLNKCGFTESIQATNSDIFVYKVGSTNLLPISNIKDINIKLVKHSNNRDVISIPDHKEPLILIFPRVWWHGYAANIGGHPLSVMPDESGVLVKIVIPSNISGNLDLFYFPLSWKYFLWVSLVSIFLLVVFSYYIIRRRI